MSRAGRADLLDADPELPARGSPASLMPTSAPVRVAVGTVQEWVRSRTGLVVTARMRVSPTDAAALCDTTVWVSARTAGSDHLVVLSALATARAVDQLCLTGVADLVLETRRAGARARLSADVTVTLSGTAPCDRLWSGGLVDLSRQGCRLRMDGRVAVAAAHPVRVDLRLRDGRMLRASGHVHRTDATCNELVVQFDDLDTADLRRLDFEVLSALDVATSA